MHGSKGRQLRPENALPAALGRVNASGWGEGRASAPGGDWRPQRIGPVPSQYSVSARREMERSILAACGVPVSLVIPMPGADAREGWRRFLHGTVGPVAVLVGAALERVRLSGRLDFRALMASDLQGRARAFRQLRDGGMGESEAQAVGGFDPAGGAVDLAVESPVVQNINRHVWKLLRSWASPRWLTHGRTKSVSTKRSCLAWRLVGTACVLFLA